jgi:hypothetical protein
MTWKDHVFVVYVVVTDPMQKTVASSVLSQLVVIATKLCVIAKIRKYKRL